MEAPKIHHLPYQIDPNSNRNHFYETLWKKEALALLARHEPNLRGMTLLDYGCGRGETMALAVERGMISSGTDMDPVCCEIASAFGKTEVLDANAEDVSVQFGRKSHDVVACFHVLEHVPRPMEVLTALRRIARRYVLVAVPNLSRPRDLIKRRNWDANINEGHLQSWDHSHFRNLAERHCGLKIIDWGFDHTEIQPFSNALIKIFGQWSAVHFETGLFKRLWPYASTSVIALMKPVEEEEANLR